MKTSPLGTLTSFQGKAIDESYQDTRDVHLSSDDDEDIKDLDTQLHFGGGKFDRTRRAETSAYGPTSSGGETLGDRYTSRRVELEERIMQKKMMKAEKIRRAEDQKETFEDMDEGFSELAGLLQFRDKEEERRVRTEKRKAGKLDEADAEMDEWDREMKVRTSRRRLGNWIKLQLVRLPLTCFFFATRIYIRSTSSRERSPRPTGPRPPRRSPRSRPRSFTTSSRSASLAWPATSSATTS